MSCLLYHQHSLLNGDGGIGKHITVPMLGTASSGKDSKAPMTVVDANVWLLFAWLVVDD